MIVALRKGERLADYAIRVTRERDEALALLRAFADGYRRWESGEDAGYDRLIDLAGTLAEAAEALLERQR